MAERYIKIGLIDCDKSKFPNLALMKIAGFYKNAELYRHGKAYDKVCASKVFSFNIYEFPPITNLEKGGSAFDLRKTLPDEIEHCRPRYSLYPDVNYSVGFYTRGCIKKCDFCIVNAKEGMISRHAELAEFVEPKFHKIICLDNNILAKREFFEECYNEKIKKFPKHSIIFKQGLDKYYIDKDISEMLGKMNAQEIAIACDHYSELGVAKRCIDFLKPLMQRILVYVLVKQESDLNTIVELANYDRIVFPYCMLYLEPGAENRRNPNQRLVWAKNKINHRGEFYHMREAGRMDFETLVAPPAETKHIRGWECEKGVDF